jgi:hypothetical protein
MSAFDAVNEMALAAATEMELEHRELPVPAEWFGIGAIVAFLLLLAITYSFRSVAHSQ